VKNALAANNPVFRKPAILVTFMGHPPQIKARAGPTAPPAQRRPGPSPPRERSRASNPGPRLCRRPTAARGLPPRAPQLSGACSPPPSHRNPRKRIKKTEITLLTFLRFETLTNHSPKCPPPVSIQQPATGIALRTRATHPSSFILHNSVKTPVISLLSFYHFEQP